MIVAFALKGMNATAATIVAAKDSRAKNAIDGRTLISMTPRIDWMFQNGGMGGAVVKRSQSSWFFTSSE
jgi:hypothetical protein